MLYTNRTSLNMNTCLVNVELGVAPSVTGFAHRVPCVNKATTTDIEHIHIHLNSLDQHINNILHASILSLTVWTAKSRMPGPVRGLHSKRETWHSTASRAQLCKSCEGVTA
jgi:hypothetical protein